MATTTKLHEERTVIRVGDVQKYQVRVYCSDGGNLPDEGLFVHQIVNQADPLQDVFVRIADIVDFSLTDGFLSSRLAATIKGDVYWRAAELTKTYDDLDVATAAVQAIFDRVNTLVNDYEVYNDDFVTAGEDLEFPTTDPTQVESLKSAYAAAYAAYLAATTAETDAKTALDSASASLTTLQTDYQDWLDLRHRFQEEDGNDQQAMEDAHYALNNFVSYGTGSALQIIGAIDSFVFSYQGKFGPETRKVSMNATGYVGCAGGDIGRVVKQDVTNHQGTLLAYNNDSREWWIAPDSGSDTFSSTTNAVRVLAGSGAVGFPTASILVGAGPLDAELTALRTARNTFDAARQQALNAVTAAYNGVIHHYGTATFIGDVINKYSAAVVQAQSDVSAAQTAYNQAQGNLQTAYTALQQAYTDVKAVCPNWSPTPPFPPVPA
jgi:hypothetical protein